MSRTVKEIAEHIKGRVVGDGRVEIRNISGIKEARAGDITFIANPKYFSLLEKTAASAVICPEQMVYPGKTLIQTENPSLAFAQIVPLFVEEHPQPWTGVHPTVVLADNVKLGQNVSIGPYSVIENGVRIGNDTVIHSHCFIGHHVTIGTGCLIYPQVTVRERVLVGNRVIIHSGAVLGSDGFGFVHVGGHNEKIPQIGTVDVQDDVEIGANVTIDRARFDKTFIGRGTKIDNLVQVAHNVRIGENCIIIAQVGISGSTVIEDNCVLAGQAGLAGHITIGAGAVVAAQAGVVSSVPPGTTVSGYPAKPHNEAKRTNAHIQRLPLYIKRLNDLMRQVEELEKKISALGPEDAFLPGKDASA